MNTLEFNQSLKDSLFIASIFIAALFIICTVSLALRNYEIRHELKKLKKWRKFSEIEKAQKHEEFDKLASELAEERTFNDTQGDMHVRLMLKYAAIQETSEKTKAEVEELSAERYRLACENTDLKQELKIAQTCLKVAETEISELKSKLERKRNEKGQFVKKSDQDRDWTHATKDELLAEAKRRYPVGTVVKCLHATQYNKIQIQDFNFDGYCIRCKNLDGYVNCVYEMGTWAQIIPNA